MTIEHTPTDQDSDSSKSAVHNTTTAVVAGLVVQAGTIAGGVHLHAVPYQPPVPRQLPPPPGFLAGRAEELAQLTTILDETAGTGATVVISAIAGIGGIGKTWLALHWAHQHADRFPDGHLFVDLRGFSPTGEPMSVAEAVRVFLDAFGIEPHRIPVMFEAQVGLYRSLVANKRMLIVLDNARDSSQVMPLLPGSPLCTVLVTSRDRLSGLVTTTGARRLALDVLDEHDSREVLAQRLGRERIDEPDAVAELLRYCAGLPLALGIVAGRATAHANFAMGVFAVELRQAATRLSSLNAGDAATSLTAVLSWSYNALTAEQAEVFGLLGLTPGPDISVPAAASLTALSDAEALAVLQVLDRVSLVDEYVPGRWRMHDLVKLYAGDRAVHDRPTQEREAALRRLVDFCLHSAYATDRLFYPHRPPIELDPPSAGCHPLALPDQAAAGAWSVAEYPSLLALHQLAVERSWYRVVWQLTWALTSFYWRRGHPHDYVTTWQAGLAAARHEGEPAMLCLAQRLLGDAYTVVGRHAEALAHLSQALDIAQGTGDLSGQADTLQVLALAWIRRGEDQRALEHATRAMHLYRDLDQPVWEAVMLNHMGWCLAQLGDHQQARTHCEASLNLFRRYPDRMGEAGTLHNLGYLAHNTGDHDQALDYYQQALTLYRDLNNTYEEANTLDRLGYTYVAGGRHGQAVDVWRQALTFYQAQHRLEDAERVQCQLDELAERRSKHPEVLDRDS